MTAADAAVRTRCRGPSPYRQYFTAPRQAASRQLLLFFGRSGDQKAVDAFLPGGVCTRAQTAVLLYRFALAMGMDVSVGEDTNILSYDDALGLGEWAVPAVQWACGAGVLQGSGSRLLPDAPCTRAQMAAFLYRALAGPDIGRKLRKFAEMRRNTAEGPRGPSPFVRDMYVAVFHSRASPPRRGRTGRFGRRAGGIPAKTDGPRSGEGGPRTAENTRWYSGGPVV